MKSPSVSVVIDERHWHVRTDEPVDQVGQLGILVTQLMRAEPFAMNLSVAHATLEGEWIWPFEGTWSELVEGYRAAFIKESAIPDSVADLSVLYDEKGEGFHSRYQSGPMERPQLLERTSRYPQPPPALPERFLYLSYAYSLQDSSDTLPQLESSLEAVLERIVEVALHTGVQFERILHDRTNP